MQISKTANQTAARRKKPRRFSFRHWWKKSRPLTFVLLCVIAAVMLIPIVFTFLYSFFPKSEISDYLNQRSSYDVSAYSFALIVMVFIFLLYRTKSVRGDSAA